MTEEQVTLAISIGGSILAALLGTTLGFLLNSWNSKRIEKKHEDKNYLEKHFDDLCDGALIPIISVASGVYRRGGYIGGNNWNSQNDIQNEQLMCFKTHYPKFAEKWIELLGKEESTKNSDDGSMHKQNEKARGFTEIVKGKIRERLANANITLPIRTYSGQEEINDDIFIILPRNMFSKAEGGNITHDFQNAEVVDNGSGKYILIIGDTTFAKANKCDTLEKCKSIFVEIQEDPTLYDKALVIIKSAENITSEFKELETELDKIQSRGLISNDKKYKFSRKEQCPICKELFFTK